MHIIFADIDQFNAFGLDITSGLSSIMKGYVRFTFRRNWLVYIPKEVYNMITLDKLVIDYIPTKKISKRIRNLRNITVFEVQRLKIVNTENSKQIGVINYIGLYNISPYLYLDTPNNYLYDTIQRYMRLK